MEPTGEHATFTTLHNAAYCIGRADEQELLRVESEAALKRSVAERIARGVLHTYKPVIDDAPYRVFATMRDYAAWCEHNVPSWLGYGKTT